LLMEDDKKLRYPQGQALKAYIIVTNATEK